MTTVEILQSNIVRTISFLDPFWPLITSHMVTFITDSLYNKYLPAKFRDDINELGFKHVMAMLFQHCHYEKVQEDCEIATFLNEIRQIHCDNRKVDFYKFSEFRNCLHSKGCKDLSIIRLNGFMTEKKCHEVSLMGVLVAELSYFTNSQLIVDIGDGKGYLSSFLALEYSLKVLGLDSSSIKTQGAAKRNLKLSKVWSGTRKKCKGANDEVVLKTELRSDKKPDYKQTTEFISDSTDIATVIHREFEEHLREIGLVGLHTCGDLSPVCLRQFVKDSNQKFIVNVGCCYHLLTEGCAQSSGFPLSRYLRDRSFRLARNARMVSLKPKWKIGSEKNVPNESLLYRAILQQIIEDKKGLKVPDNVQVGRIAGKCSSFSQYVRMAFDKLSLDIQISDTEVDEYFQKYSEVRSQLWIYFMMFCCLSSLIEDIILLDRLLYLKEQGIEKSYIVEMFDPVVSPRSHAIIAYRSTN